ncbi:tRNA (guanosine(37)-N1)-methyltransferase TrmD [Rhodosalinus sp. 5P4]|uniref:tRNA (guanosine(37)-N1)-methyltransferase TrmD n=1 Tax=Rhodosalinus sp. 5P4 TaxID=3239196 RepID=UPI00352386DC
MSDAPARSHGRKSISAAVGPRELMPAQETLAGVWCAQVITLFPEAFPGVLGLSLTGRGLKEGLWQLRTVDLRRHGEGRHRNVDDTPAGGGAGMVLRADVLGRAIEEARATAPAGRPLIAPSPRGTPFTQARARALAEGPGVTLICGRFEGIDQRALDHYGVEEVSIGDFVLTGGEIAATALIDATVRLIPRVLGNQASVEEESFSHGLLEHPQYTRPTVWQGREIPEILLSGHHARITEWRQAEAERLTRKRRPDLWRAWREAHRRNPEDDREL